MYDHGRRIKELVTGQEKTQLYCNLKRYSLKLCTSIHVAVMYCMQRGSLSGPKVVFSSCAEVTGPQTISHKRLSSGDAKASKHIPIRHYFWCCGHKHRYKNTHNSHYKA